MKGKLQGSNTITINAPREKVWNTITDSGSLHKWVNMIKHVDNPTSALNAKRSCEVVANGRKGTTNEVCEVYDEQNKLGWVVHSDTLGFAKMLDHFGMLYTLSDKNGATQVELSSHYNPKNFIVAIMNTLMMKRMNNKMRSDMLKGLKNYIENKN